MNCNEVQKRLPAYQEGESGQDERTMIEDHLKSCGKCSRELDMLIKTKKHLSAMKEVEPPHWLEKRIMQQVHEEAGQKKHSLPSRLPWLPVMAKAIPVIFLVVIGYLVYHAMDLNQMGSKKYEEKQQVQSEPLKKERSTGKAERDEAVSGRLERKAVPAVPSTPQVASQEPPKEQPAAASPAPGPERAIPSKKEEEGLVQEADKFRAGMNDAAGQEKMMLSESREVQKPVIFHVTLETREETEDIVNLLAHSGIARPDIEVRPDGPIHAKLSRDKIETIISELKKIGDLTHSDSVSDILPGTVSIEITIVKIDR
jgi:hypothetical protein